MSRHRMLAALSMFCSILGLLGALEVQPSPGIYGKAIEVKIQWPYTDTTEISWDQKTWVAAPQMLYLDALNGEERVYEFSLRNPAKPNELQKFSYVIDRKGPDYPLPDKLPGSYEGNQTLVLVGSEDTSSITYVLNGKVQTQKGSRVSIPLESGPGTPVSYVLTAKGQDKFGNEGRIFEGTWRLTSLQADKVPKNLVIHSPKEGVFANQQWLILDTEGFVELRYTLDGTEPSAGTLYKTPLPLPTDKTIKLEVWGRDVSGKTHTARTEFVSANLDILGQKQGFIGETFTIQPDTSCTYSLIDSRPGPQGPVLAQKLTFKYVEGTKNFYSLRLTKKNDGSQYRYSFWMDGSVPGLPQWYSQLLDPFDNNTSGAGVNQFRFLVGLTSNQLEYTAVKGIDAVPAGTSDGRIRVLPGSRVLNVSAIRSLYGTGPSRSANHSLVSPSIQNLNPLELASTRQGSVILLNKPYFTGKSWMRWVSSPWQKGTWFKAPQILESLGAGLQWKGPLVFELLTAESVDTWTLQSCSLVWDDVFQAGPTMTRNGRTLALTSETGSVEYSLSRKGGVQGQFRPYDGPFELPLQVGENIDWQVAAHIKLPDGTRSLPLLFSDLAVHDKIPETPEISISPDPVSLLPTMVLGNKSYSLGIRNRSPDLLYYYVLSLEKSTPVSGALDAGLTLSIPEQMTLKGTLEVFATSKFNPELQSKALIVDFIHDRAPPAVPVLASPLPASSQGPLKLAFMVNSGERVDYILDSGSGTVTKESFTTYTEPLVLQVEDGRIQSFKLWYKAVDMAGNESPLVGPLGLSLDREAPPRPEVMVLSAQGMNLEAQRDNSSRYVLNQKAYIRGTSSTDSLVYSFDGSTFATLKQGLALELDGRTRSHEDLTVFAEDAAGNRSLPSNFSFDFDFDPPALPPEPLVLRSNNVVELRWKQSKDILEYRLQGSEAWTRFQEAPSYQLREGEEPLTVQYRLRDEAGNISDSQSITLGYQPVLNPPQPLNLGSGVLPLPYMIQFPLDPDTTIRYELADSAKEVGPESPRYIDGIYIPLESVEKQVILSWRAWKDGFEPSLQVDIPIVVDGISPQKPELRIVETVRSNGTSISISLQDGSLEGTLLIQGQFIVSGLEGLSLFKTNESALTIPEYTSIAVNTEYFVPQDSIGVLSASFKVRDLAGNESESLAFKKSYHPGTYFVGTDKTLALDPKSRSGSIFEPCTLAEAIRFGAQKLVLGTGVYTLDNVRPGKNVHFMGGFDFSRWKFKDRDADSEPSIFIPASKTTESLLVLDSGTCTLENVFLSDGSFALQSLVRANKANLYLNAVTSTSNRGKSALTSVQGLLSIKGSRILAQDGYSGSLISISGGTMLIENTRVESLALPPSLQRRVNSAQSTLINLVDVSGAQIRSSTIQPRSGQLTKALSISGSSLELRDSFIHAGDGSQGAVALESSNSAIVCNTVRFLGSTEAANVTLIRLDGGNLRSNVLTLDVSGKSGVMGIIGQNAWARMEDTEMTGSGGQDFGTFFSLNDSRFEVIRPRINVLRSGRDLVLFRLLGSDLLLEDAQISVAAKNTATAFQVLRASSLQLQNATLKANGEGTCLDLDPGIESISIEDSIIAGWKYFATLKSGDGTNIDLDEDDLLQLGLGSRIRNNQIQKGL